MYKDLTIYYSLGTVATVLFSIAYALIISKYNYKIKKSHVIILIGCSIFMLVFQVLKYHSLRFYVDFSHWTNLLHNISSTGKPYSSFHEMLKPGSLNYLSVHFVPLIYLIAIPFKIFPYSETLIVVNYIIMVSAGIPLYKISYHYYKDQFLSLMIVACLFWYMTFQYIVLYEFEMLRLSIPIILWVLYFFEVQKFKPYFITLFLAVLVREEVGLTIFMFGIYLMIFDRKKLIGMWSSIIGLGGFLIITQFIMPLFRADSYQHIAMGSFSKVGNSEIDIIKNIIFNPITVISAIFDYELVIKLANIFMYFLPLLFIPILSYRTLIPILAPFGIGFLSGHITHSSYMLYYASSALPFIFYSLIKGWDKYLKILQSVISKLIKKREVNILNTAMGTLLTAVLISNIIFGSSPFSLQFWFKDIRPAPFNTQNHHFTAYKINAHNSLANSITELVPDTSIVACPAFLFPRVFNKKNAAYLNNRESSFDVLSNIREKDKIVTYIFFDTKNENLSMKRYEVTTNRILDYIKANNKNWELIKSVDGYYLYKRVDA